MDKAINMIELKPSQKQIVKSLLYRMCMRDDSGLLVYHFMGTGKTLAALAVATNFMTTAHPVYVVCPDELKFVWNLDYVKTQVI